MKRWVVDEEARRTEVRMAAPTWGSEEAKTKVTQVGVGAVGAAGAMPAGTGGAMSVAQAVAASALSQPKRRSSLRQHNWGRNQEAAHNWQNMLGPWYRKRCRSTAPRKVRCQDTRAKTAMQQGATRVTPASASLEDAGTADMETVQLAAGQLEGEMLAAAKQGAVVQLRRLETSAKTDPKAYLGSR